MLVSAFSALTRYGIVRYRRRRLFVSDSKGDVSLRSEDVSCEAAAQKRNNTIVKPTDVLEAFVQYIFSSRTISSGSLKELHIEAVQDLHCPLAVSKTNSGARLQGVPGQSIHLWKYHI